MKNVVIAINPGSTSTKIGIYEQDKVVVEQNISHSAEELNKFELVTEQFDIRYKGIKEFLDKNLDTNKYKVVAVVGRGGPLKPLEGGVIEINEKMLEDYKSCKYSNHASNLGSIIAHKLASEFNVKSYIADPVTVDNFWDISRITGFPGMERKCRSHALNIKATARKEAEKLGKKLEDLNFVVAHIGGGISIVALEKGKIRDANNGLLGEGPFSPGRAGVLPLDCVIDYCFSGKKKSEIEKDFSVNSGFQGYLGTTDLIEVEKRIENGDKEADLIWRAFVFQIAKEIGKEATALKGDFNSIIITGGIANSEKFIKDLKQYISFLGNISVYAGEGEMEALSKAGFLAVSNQVEIKQYS